MVYYNEHSEYVRKHVHTCEQAEKAECSSNYVRWHWSDWISLCARRKTESNWITSIETVSTLVSWAAHVTTVASERLICRSARKCKRSLNIRTYVHNIVALLSLKNRVRTTKSSWIDKYIRNNELQITISGIVMNLPEVVLEQNKINVLQRNIFLCRHPKWNRSTDKITCYEF